LAVKETNESTVQELGESLARYEIAEAGKPAKKWTLWLFPDYFQLENAEGELHEVDHLELRERVQMMESSLFLRRVLVVTLGKKKVFFQLSPEAFAAVNEWIGPPTLDDLKVELKKRTGWLLPIMFVRSGWREYRRFTPERMQPKKEVL